MNELHMKASTIHNGIHIPARPPRITGYILKIGKYFGGKNRRYFELNPIEGNFIKYMTKEDCPKKPKEIYCVSNILNLLRLPNTSKQTFHFIEVSYISN